MPPNGLELPALGRQARVPARRRGHDFYSMTSEMAGKCAFPLPCVSIIHVKQFDTILV